MGEMPKTSSAGRKADVLFGEHKILGWRLTRAQHLVVAMEDIMAKVEQTSEKAGKAASKVLRDDRTGKNSKTAAGSALTQRPSKK
jgi:hypothetical protein